MVVGFCSIGGWCYSGWWVWDLRTLVQFQGSEMSSELFQDFMDGYVKLSTLVVELSVVVMTLWLRVPNQDDTRLNPVSRPFSTPVL